MAKCIVHSTTHIGTHELTKGDIVLVGLNTEKERVGTIDSMVCDKKSIIIKFKEYMSPFDYDECIFICSASDYK